MDKRYQVFVSSTYFDLQEERQKVMHTLMDINCIPVGMEFFPSIDEEQFAYIKREIDDSDYYVLVIGGRYGSLGETGISYTEMEFDYAKAKKIPIIAFLHKDLDSIPLGKSEKEEEKRKLLERFRAKVSSERLVKFWSNADELCGQVAVSLLQTISSFPAIGWVRANMQTNVESLQEINTLRKELAESKNKLLKFVVNKQETSDLADFDEKIKLKGTYHYFCNQKLCKEKWECEITWKQIFMSIAPYLMDMPSDSKAKKMLTSIVFSYTSINKEFQHNINSQDFQTIKIQLMAYKLIDVSYLKTTKGNKALFWKLTEFGKQIMIQLRTIKTSKK